MEHILKLVSNDRYIQHQAYHAFKKKWPQINDETRISYTDQRTVYLVQALEPRSLTLPFFRMTVSGWRKLRGTAMSPTLKRLDDPTERTAYSHRLYVAIFMSPMYLFWRVIGKLFRRNDWYERGTELVPDPVIRMPQIDRREIHLEAFGWQQDYPHYMHKEPERGYFVCGYDPVQDTLWIRRD